MYVQTDLKLADLHNHSRRLSTDDDGQVHARHPRCHISAKVEHYHHPRLSSSLEDPSAMQCPPPAHDHDGETSGTPTTAPATTEERDASTIPVPRSDKDDLDLMLLHEDFPLLLTLAAKVKELRNSTGGAVVAAAPSGPPPAVPTDDAIEAAKRIRSKTLATSVRQGQLLTTILRGQYPMTDILMDDALMELQDEIDAHEFQSATDVPLSPTSNDLVAVLSDSLGTHGQHPPPAIHYDPKKKGDAIAIKYSKWQTDILMNWMIANSESPFPDPSDVAELAASTGLTHSQVVNWTTNVRKRNLKATCRGNKKPHHFIDFLFLKQDREARRQGGRDAAAAGGGIRYPPANTSSGFAADVPSSTAAAKELLAPHTSVHSTTSHRESRGDGGGVGGRRFRERMKDPYPDSLVDPRSAPDLPMQEEAHELEPLEWTFPEYEKAHGFPHQELLEDFANYWTDDDEDSSYLLDASTTLTAAAQGALDDLEAAAWIQSKPPARIVSAPSRGFHTRHRRMLMPSVTLDSHDDERYGAPESASRGRRTSFSAKGEGRWKRNRAPTPPPLDELYLYPTDLEDDVTEYLQLNNHESRQEERYEDDDEDDWIRAWDIDDV